MQLAVLIIGFFLYLAGKQDGNTGKTRLSTYIALAFGSNNTNTSAPGGVSTLPNPTNGAVTSMGQNPTVYNNPNGQPINRRSAVTVTSMSGVSGGSDDIQSITAPATTGYGNNGLYGIVQGQ